MPSVEREKILHSLLVKLMSKASVNLNDDNLKGNCYRLTGSLLNTNIQIP